jgi:hypothetical protein
MDQNALDAMMAGLARIEAVLRAAHSDALEAGFPVSWVDGRRRKILEFCLEPRTQQQIREHIGSIAGYEVKQYLDEGLRCGVLASFGTGSCERYLTVLAPPPVSRRTKRASRGKTEKDAGT